MGFAGLLPSEIAASLTKVGGGPPTKQAIALLRRQIAADALWYPGKVALTAKKPGPKPLLTEAKKLLNARSAMALKEGGEEPSVAAVIQRCPKATLNPETDEPFTDKYILEVFRQKCFDPAATASWDRHHPYQRTALPECEQCATESGGTAGFSRGMTALRRPPTLTRNTLGGRWRPVVL